MVVCALSIAGSDSGGGAGIQADMKVMSALGVYATTSITALTAQNTRGVQDVFPISADFVISQLSSVLDDIEIAAIKTGMLANKEILARVAQYLANKAGDIPLVVDPVMVSQTGDPLLEEDAVEAMKQELIPLATIITPNLPESSSLLKISEDEILQDPWQAARSLLDLGAKAVLIKGGHTPNSDADYLEDYFLEAGGKQMTLTNPRIATTNTHGSGCSLAAAITSYLARGLSLSDAVTSANGFILEAIKAADRIHPGKHIGNNKDKSGDGPVHHLHPIW